MPTISAASTPSRRPITKVGSIWLAGGWPHASCKAHLQDRPRACALTGRAERVYRRTCKGASWRAGAGSNERGEMRSRLLTGLVAVFVFGVAVPTASATGFAHLQPGVPEADLKEQVRVNVVFVGFAPSQVRQPAFLAGLPKARARSSLPALLRQHRAARDRLQLRLLADVHERGLGERLLRDAQGARAARAADRLPGGRTTTRTARPDVGPNNFIDAPTVERWLAEHAPAGVDTAPATRSSSSTGAGARTSSLHVYIKSGEPDPDTGYDFGVEPAEPQAHRLGRHDARRRGDRPRRRAAATASGSTTSPPGPSLGLQLGRRRRRPRRRRRARLPHAAGLGVRASGYRAPIGADRRPRARSRATWRSTCCSPPSPLYPPVPDAAAASVAAQPRPQHVRGVAGRRRVRPVPEAGATS